MGNYYSESPIDYLKETKVEFLIENKSGIYYIKPSNCTMVNTEIQNVDIAEKLFRR